MTTAHTPGPWIVTDYLNTHVIRGAEEPREHCGIKFVFRDFVCSMWGGYHEADARLIAASPAMLQSLEDLLEAADALRQTCEVIRGRHPEEDDTHIHEQWAEKLLTEKAEAVRAVIRAAKGES